MSGWAYMLRCADGSYYVGSTSYEDVGTRVAEHNDARFIGYTSRRRPVVLVWSTFFDDLRDAHETERRVKGWSRRKKEALIAGDEQALVSAAVRRGGKKRADAPSKSRRELSWKAQATGSKRPDARVRTRKPKLAAQPARTSEEAKAAQERRLLIASYPRHPEVRAKRAPKDV